MPFRVNQSLCETCIFSTRTPISNARFEALKASWDANQNVQLCHHSETNVGCRGHYEAARRGAIPHPLPVLLAEYLGISQLQTADAMQIAERLGIVEFCVVDDR